MEAADSILISGKLPRPPANQPRLPSEAAMAANWSPASKGAAVAARFAAGSVMAGAKSSYCPNYYMLSQGSIRSGNFLKGPCSAITRADRKSQVRQCLSFCLADS